VLRLKLLRLNLGKAEDPLFVVIAAETAYVSASLPPDTPSERLELPP